MTTDNGTFGSLIQRPRTCQSTVLDIASLLKETWMLLSRLSTCRDCDVQLNVLLLYSPVPLPAVCYCCFTVWRFAFGRALSARSARRILLISNTPMRKRGQYYSRPSQQSCAVYRPICLGTAQKIPESAPLSWSNGQEVGHEPGDFSKVYLSIETIRDWDSFFLSSVCLHSVCLRLSQSIKPTFDGSRHVDASAILERSFRGENGHLFLILFIG